MSEQWAGAVLLLVAFGCSLSRASLAGQSVWYLLSNVVGSFMLAQNALHTHQWGFVLLEGMWSIVAGIGLLSRAWLASAAVVFLPSTSRTNPRPRRRAGRPRADTRRRTLHSEPVGVQRKQLRLVDGHQTPRTAGDER